MELQNGCLSGRVREAVLSDQIRTNEPGKPIPGLDLSGLSGVKTCPVSTGRQSGKCHNETNPVRVFLWPPRRAGTPAPPPPRARRGRAARGRPTTRSVRPPPPQLDGDQLRGELGDQRIATTRAPGAPGRAGARVTCSAITAATAHTCRRLGGSRRDTSSAASSATGDHRIATASAPPPPRSAPSWCPTAALTSAEVMPPRAASRSSSRPYRRDCEQGDRRPPPPRSAGRSTAPTTKRRRLARLLGA